jgi:hypothetical protein
LCRSHSAKVDLPRFKADVVVDEDGAVFGWIGQGMGRPGAFQLRQVERRRCCARESRRSAPCEMRQRRPVIWSLRSVSAAWAGGAMKVIQIETWRSGAGGDCAVGSG